MSPSAMNVLSRTCVPRVMCSWIGRGTPYATFRSITQSSAPSS